MSGLCNIGIEVKFSSVHILLFSGFFVLFLFFCGSGIQTQCFQHARKVFFHWVTVTTPQVSIFWKVQISWKRLISPICCWRIIGSLMSSRWTLWSKNYGVHSRAYWYFWPETDSSGFESSQTLKKFVNLDSLFNLSESQFVHLQSWVIIRVT